MNGVTIHQPTYAGADMRTRERDAVGLTVKVTYIDELQCEDLDANTLVLQRLQGRDSYRIIGKPTLRAYLKGQCEPPSTGEDAGKI
jgi:hypothetical protein